MNTYASKDQMVELGTSLLKALVGIEDAPKARVQELIENPAHVKEVARIITVLPLPQETLGKSTEPQLASWVSLYAEMDITLDPSEVKIPSRKKGFNHLIVVAKGMTAQKAYGLCKQRFSAWKYTDNDLDTAVPTNDRTADNAPYAVWVRDRQEADEELKNKSADDLAEEGIKGITLTERLLLELKFHKETGTHMDIRNWTLCSGSRYSDGDVPCVHWSDSKLLVYWSCSNNRFSDLRSRAVSL